MDWYERDFDHPDYFEIYANKEKEAAEEGSALATYLNLPPNSLVLDLPCGWGRLHPYWAMKGWKTVGGDLSSLNLDIHASKHPNELVRLDFRHLPFKSSVADGVMCAFTSWGYFHEEEDNLRQLCEFARVLKPGGILLLDLAGRHYLENAIVLMEGYWYHVDDGDYMERVRWTRSKKRIITDRIKNGHHFRHNIWIPTENEIKIALEKSGFHIDKCWGGLGGEKLMSSSERWIYRAICEKTTKPTPLSNVDSIVSFVYACLILATHFL
ncbi:MAG: class I SAM-dependent methyltransferase [Holophagaceae bacterium]|nr:class I SAM-dependent methyltransferase [Holophagaceae bacterium]